MGAADYAFADMVFEGEIIDVVSKTRYDERLKKELVISSRLLFNVDKVLRGEMNDTQVLVGSSNHTYAVQDLEAFVKRYGRHFRVGLVTPEQHKLHCRGVVTEYINSIGEKTLRTLCDFNYPSLESAREIPFVQTVSCGNSFIFDSTKPIVLPDYYRGNYNSKLLSIFREYSDWFTPELTENSQLMDHLIEEGLKLYPIDQQTVNSTDQERESIIESTKDRLRKGFLVFANLSQTDPDLRERFLRDDLFDTSR